MWPVWASFEVFGRPLYLTGYGLFAILGAAIGTYLCVRSARRLGFADFDSFAASALAVAFGLLGAKLMFLLVSIPRIRVDGIGPYLAHGGLVWYGGLIGGAAAALLYLWAYRLDILAFAEAVAPALAIGHGLGRIGCFLGGCCHGTPTGLPWGVSFPDSPFFGGPPGVPLHPVQLYEAGAELLLGLLVWRLVGRLRRGGAFAVWLAGYGAVRLTMELLFRGDDRGLGLLGASPSTLISIGAMVLGVLFLAWPRAGLTSETKVS